MGKRVEQTELSQHLSVDRTNHLETANESKREDTEHVEKGVMRGLKITCSTNEYYDSLSSDFLASFKVYT